MSRMLWLTCVVVFCCASSSFAGIDVWVESSGVMVLPDRQPGTLKAIERSGVRNEYVTAQIGLRTDAPPPTPYSFVWTGLTSPNGTRIGKGNTRLFRGHDIIVDHGTKLSEAKDKARHRRMGAFPDALVPLVKRDGTNVANAITPGKDRTVPIWVDIFIPEKTPPGEYVGEIQLKQGAAAVATIPVKVNVLPVTIPADSSIPSIFNLRIHPHVRANLDDYVAEVMRHRIQPTNYHYADYVGRPRDGFSLMDRLNPGGRGCVSIGFYSQPKPTEAQLKRIIDSLKKLTPHLKKRGLFDRSFIYLKDEPSLKEIPGVIAVAKRILRDVPEWKGKLLCTLNKEGTELDGLLTHHVRALKVYGKYYYQEKSIGGRKEWAARRAKGQQLWFYVSNAQGTPFPTFDVQTVNLAWEPRVLPWAYWYEKAYGHLFWDLMFKPRWTLVRSFPPGDGQLLYPGDFTMAGAPDWVQVKDLKGPVVSRRLKHHREGLEEWELLRMAERKVGRAKVEAIVSRVYRCMGLRTWRPAPQGLYDPKSPMWSYDESAWDSSRQEVIELLQ